MSITIAYPSIASPDVAIQLDDVEQKPTSRPRRKFQSAFETDSGGLFVYDWGSSVRAFSMNLYPLTAFEKDALVSFFDNSTTAANVAADATANANDGTLNGVPAWIKGRFGGALSFDGVNDNVNFGDVHLFDFDATESFTVEVRYTAIGDDGGILSKRANSSAASPGWLIWHWNGDNKVRVDLGDGTLDRERSEDVAIVTGATHLYSAVIDRAAAEMRFLKDGLQQGAVFDLTGFGSMVNSEDFLMGNFSGGGRLGEFKLDEARIWDKARSNGEVLGDVNQELVGTETNLVGLWKINDGPGPGVNGRNETFEILDSYGDTWSVKFAMDTIAPIHRDGFWEVPITVRVN